MIVRELVVALNLKSDQAKLKKTEGSLNKLTKAARFLGAAFVTGAAARGFKSLIDLASDAEERQNKLAAVFGQSTAMVNKSLAETSKNTGIATGQLQEYASEIGAVVKPALGSAEAAGKMSARVAELALDIASFNNLKPEEALAKLRAGLIGSTEPLDSVGINLRANNIGLKEYAARVGKTAEQLTQGEKIQLRYNAILRQIQIQGALKDATSTSKGFANASRALFSQLKALGEEIGKIFLPIAGKTVAVLLKATMAVVDFVKANKELVSLPFISVFRVFKALVEAVTTPLGLVFAGVLALGLALTKMGVVGFASWVAAFFPAAAAAVLIGLISAAIFLLIDDLQTMGDGGESVIGTLITGFTDLFNEMGSVTAVIREALTTAFDFWADFFGDMFGVADETIEQVKELFSGLTAFIKGVFDFVFDRIDNVGSGIGKILSGDFASGFKDLAAGAGITGGLPALVAAGGAGVANANVSSTATININGAGDPQAVGREAASELVSLQQRDLNIAGQSFTPAAQ